MNEEKKLEKLYSKLNDEYLDIVQYILSNEEFKNETLAIDFHIYGSPDRGTLAIIHEPEAN